MPRFAFDGMRFDPATGFYISMTRPYDPRTGRWVEPDFAGLGPDTNPERFCGNSPTNFVDPSGMDDGPIMVNAGRNNGFLLGADGQVWGSASTETQWGSAGSANDVAGPDIGAWLWNNVAGPFVQQGADIANAATNFVADFDNLFIFAANAGIEVVNDLGRMSNYGYAPFSQPLPYCPKLDWSRNLVMPEANWVHQLSTFSWELLAGFGVRKLASSLGDAVGVRGALEDGGSRAGKSPK